MNVQKGWHRDVEPSLILSLHMSKVAYACLPTGGSNAEDVPSRCYL